MTNHNKAKGSKFESDVVQFLRDNGFPQAARTLAGARDDRGDISGVPDEALQVKNHRGYELGPWMVQAQEQAVNAHVPNATVVAKRRGVGDIGEQFVIIPLRQWVELKRRALNG